MALRQYMLLKVNRLFFLQPILLTYSINFRQKDSHEPITEPLPLPVSIPVPLQHPLDLAKSPLSVIATLQISYPLPFLSPVPKMWSSQQDHIPSCPERKVFVITQPSSQTP